jgi:hypothetical protein
MPFFQTTHPPHQSHPRRCDMKGSATEWLPRRHMPAQHAASRLTRPIVHGGAAQPWHFRESLSGAIWSVPESDSRRPANGLCGADQCTGLRSFGGCQLRQRVSVHCCDVSCWCWNFPRDPERRSGSSRTIVAIDDAGPQVAAPLPPSTPDVLHSQRNAAHGST